MLKYSDATRSQTPIFELSVDEDKKLRKAFGHSAKSEFRQAGAEVVSYHQDRGHWFHCDCRPDMQRAPTLFLVENTHIRRESSYGNGVTLHDEQCDFYRLWDEQIKLVRTYRRPATEGERKFNLLYNLGEGDSRLLSQGSRTSTRDERPTLAKVLCALLHEAGLDLLQPKAFLKGNRDEQGDALKRAAESFTFARNRRLSDWLDVWVGGYYRLKKRLEKERWSDGWRPHGVFIGTFDERIKDRMLYPAGPPRRPIPITGSLTAFGEKERFSRPPYLVIGLLGRTSRETSQVELLRAYAHPVDWRRLMLVDSNLERETLENLIACRKPLEERGIEITIQKPVFDMGPHETKDSREVCIPDFVLHCRGVGVRHETVVIETMGYDNPGYRERKRRMRPLFEQVGNGPYPVPVLEHDPLRLGTRPAAVNAVNVEFRDAVYTAITGRRWRYGARLNPREPHLL